MKLLKINVVLTMLFLSFNLIARNNMPMFFQLMWSSSFNQVQSRINEKDVGLGKLTHYSILGGKDEVYDLSTSAKIMYVTKGSPFFNIPAEVIFTFYNPSNSKNDLQLAKVELYLSRKDNDNIWVDVKNVFKNFVRIFFDNYDLNLIYRQERRIFTEYDYKISVNGIYVTFIANVGDSILDNDKSVFISYESNQIQNLILKKDAELLRDVPKYDEDTILKNTKDNL